MPSLSAPLVCIVDYGMGNLFSVRQACEYAGLRATFGSRREDILGADAVILPGVGAFGDAMSNLGKLGLIEPLLDFIRKGSPFMGICLGMQLLFSESEEFGRHRGLDVIKGSVVRFPFDQSRQGPYKVPHIGWNRINRPSSMPVLFWQKTPLAGLEDGEFMYFVHSFYALPSEEGVTLSSTQYGNVRYCSSLLWKNVLACQFHPEKSASQGLMVYKNWALIIDRER